jgi:hypothetical protein
MTLSVDQIIAAVQAELIKMVDRAEPIGLVVEHIDTEKGKITIRPPDPVPVFHLKEGIDRGEAYARLKEAVSKAIEDGKK